MVDSVQYLVCQRGAQLIPTAAAAYVMAFHLLQKKAEIVKKLSKTQPFKNSIFHWIVNTCIIQELKMERKLRKRKSRATK